MSHAIKTLLNEIEKYSNLLKNLVIYLGKN